MHLMIANMASPSFPELIFAIVLALSFVTVIAVLSVIALRPLFNSSNGRNNADKAILSGEITLIYKDERCIRIVGDGEDYKLAKGEVSKIFSLHDRRAMIEPHHFYTSDGAKIIVNACAIWGIVDIRTLLRSSLPSDDVLSSIVQVTVISALADAVIACKYADFAQNMSAIANQARRDVDDWLRRYGLVLYKLSITPFDLPPKSAPSKSEGQKEAETLSALNEVVPTVDMQTLYHRRRMFELELVKEKEGHANKKA